MRSVGTEAFGLVWVLFIIGAWLAAFVFWLLKIVEVAKLPDQQYRNAGTEKVTWVLVVVLVGLIGALVWHFVKRSEVLAAPAGYTGAAPQAGLGPAPGWYPDGQQPGLRWWDGAHWTDHRHGGPRQP